MPLVLPPQAGSQPSISKSPVSYGDERNHTAAQIDEPEPLSPNGLRSKTRSKPSTVTPHYYPSAMAKTLNKYQETILGLAIVELEIEVMYLQEYNLEQARRRPGKEH